MVGSYSCNNLAILLTSLDTMATNLAKRLNGLPLALAIAGVYLGRTRIPCKEYYDSYQTA